MDPEVYERGGGRGREDRVTNALMDESAHNIIYVMHSYIYSYWSNYKYDNTHPPI